MWPLETLYQEHSSFSLLCDDRIQLRTYVEHLSYGGGFCSAAKQLRPDQPITQSWLGSLVRRFHEGIKRFTQEHDIPVVERTRDDKERLEEVAARHRQAFTKPTGVYLIVRQRELAKVWHSHVEPLLAIASAAAGARPSPHPLGPTEARYHEWDCRFTDIVEALNMHLQN